MSPRAAPGRLAVVQEFVNTQDAAEEHDALKEPRGLESWLAVHDLVTGGVRLTDEDWRHALALREGLRRVIRSHNDGESLELSVIAELNEMASEVALSHRFLFEKDGSPHLITETPGWPGAMTRFLTWIAEAQEEGRWARLKECASEKCRRIFYDSSNNDSAKWCNSRRCGNRAHTKTYRQRKPRWMR